MTQPSWNTSPTTKGKRRSCRSCAISKQWRLRYAIKFKRHFDASTNRAHASRVENASRNVIVSTAASVSRATLQGKIVTTSAIAPTKIKEHSATFNALRMTVTDSSMMATGDEVMVTAKQPLEPTRHVPINSTVPHHRVTATSVLQRPLHLDSRQDQHRSPHLSTVHPLRHDPETDLALAAPMSRDKALGLARTSVPARHCHRPRATCRVTATIQLRMRHSK